jgi:cyclohexa-1,5-dienecarbonyl-CoA hydratase
VTQPLSVAFNGDRTRAAFTIYHPKGNIITADLVAAMRSALDSMAENPHLKLISIEGAGADFSFGASIPEHASGQIERVLPEMHALIYELLEAPAPTAAVVRGRCFGGGFELALACDFIFAARGASFALPEIALGVFPPAASALLPLRAGHARGTQAILTGAAVPAAGWEGAGLVEVLAEDEARLTEAVESWCAAHLAAKSAAALRHAATAARMGLLAQVRDVLPKLERLYLDDLMRTQDAVEGIDAFLARRAPLWTDR